MPMSPLERKAAFLYAVTMNQTTLESAAKDACGVTWFHLSQGIAHPEYRTMSDEVKQRFADYIGKTVDEVFGSPVPADENAA